MIEPDTRPGPSKPDTGDIQFCEKCFWFSIIFFPSLFAFICTAFIIYINTR